jgi:hypothetical protein
MATYPLYADDPINGNVIINNNHLLQESALDGLTAIGNSQATALPLLNEMNRFSTVAAGTGAMLPQSKPGLTIFIVNHGANSLQVYGNGTDTIDDQATTTGVTQMVNSTVLYVCHTAGTWYTEGLATGFQKGLGLQT